VTVDGSSVWLNELTWPDVAAYLERPDRIVLIPVGATEQHGAAGPLGVDTYVATSLAEDTAVRSGVLCCPPIWFGDSEFHMGFPGTIALRTETLMAVMLDVISSLLRHGFNRIMVINGHKGANLFAISPALRKLKETLGSNAILAVADPLFLARHAASEIKSAPEHHSGELELSQVLYKHPGLVQLGRLSDDTVDFDSVFGGLVADDLFGRAPEGVEIAWSSAEQRRFTPTGSFAPSSGVSEEKGRLYHEHMVDRLCVVIDWMRTYEGPLGSGRNE
jgi:creatinine amidohydrolase